MERRIAVMILVPDYYKRFKCIADRCADSCCIGWEIDVDARTLEKYRSLGALGDEILGNIELSADPPYIKLDECGRCPNLDERGLCRIISRLGEGYIPDICKNHPRYYNELCGFTECSVGLACPEAARIILGLREKPKLEFLNDISTENAKIRENQDFSPTLKQPSDEKWHKSPTSIENRLFLLRDEIFSFVFDKRNSVEGMISGLFVFDKRLSDAVFDMQAGIDTEISRVCEADFAELSPLIGALGEAISKIELLSEDYRRGFAEPDAEIIRERLLRLGDGARALIYYFVHRYFLADLEWLDVESRLSLAAMLLLLLLLSSDEISEHSAVAFSKNVEYSTENVDILLDIISQKA